MAAITVNASLVAPADPIKSDIKTFIAAAKITKGQSLFINASGKVDLCDANVAGNEQFIGIALTPAAAGQAVDVLMRGPVYGFDLSAVAYGGPAFQGDTAGVLDTAAGTKTVRVGRVLPTSDNDLTKILYVNSDWSQVW